MSACLARTEAHPGASTKAGPRVAPAREAHERARPLPKRPTPTADRLRWRRPGGAGSSRGRVTPTAPCRDAQHPALALAPEAAPAGEPYRGGQPNKKKQASSASRQAEMEETCFFN
ncbi:hypothetical protein BBD40_29070 [Paenibacillus ihbetae]|uniref:Uncharacterized protein n=1 Tax=Paenibacillus ihbetae TaxID=1870820 RepID=A0ABX3JMD9_9BACL|nr:hypothetical protein BBD40_29070 [Paenibacillus ihbetae]